MCRPLCAHRVTSWSIRLAWLTISTRRILPRSRSHSDWPNAADLNVHIIEAGRICTGHTNTPLTTVPRLRAPVAERSLLTIRCFDQGASRNSQKDVPTGRRPFLISVAASRSSKIPLVHNRMIQPEERPEHLVNLSKRDAESLWDSVESVWGHTRQKFVAVLETFGPGAPGFHLNS